VRAGEVIDDLATDHRCIAPTLRLGAHRHGMRADADLTLPAIARLVDELPARLSLSDVTIVGIDTGGALVQLLIGAGAGRVSRDVLASCDAFDNFLPGTAQTDPRRDRGSGEGARPPRRPSPSRTPNSPLLAGTVRSRRRSRT
jgi:pimeloyl-ACP methyl ester carboxylesterase